MTGRVSLDTVRVVLRERRALEARRALEQLSEAERARRARLRDRVHLWRFRTRQQLRDAKARLDQLQRQGPTTNYWIKSVDKTERRIALLEARARILRT